MRAYKFFKRCGSSISTSLFNKDFSQEVISGWNIPKLGQFFAFQFEYEALNWKEDYYPCAEGWELWEVSTPEYNVIDFEPVDSCQFREFWDNEYFENVQLMMKRCPRGTILVHSFIPFYRVHSTRGICL